LQVPGAGTAETTFDQATLDVELDPAQGVFTAAGAGPTDALVDAIREK